jgi:hypothetical protein
MTYGGQGVKKRGVQAQHHAIIYTGSKPVMFKGEKEKGLRKQPIRMEPSDPRHILDPASRLNYGSPYNIEYNVKVWFLGKIHSKSEHQLEIDYNRVHPRLAKEEDQPPSFLLKNAHHYSTASYGGEAHPAGTGNSVPISGSGVGQNSDGEDPLKPADISTPDLPHGNPDPIDEQLNTPYGESSELDDPSRHQSSKTMSSSSSSPVETNLSSEVLTLGTPFPPQSSDKSTPYLIGRQDTPPHQVSKSRKGVSDDGKPEREEEGHDLDNWPSTSLQEEEAMAKLRYKRLMLEEQMSRTGGDHQSIGGDKMSNSGTTAQLSLIQGSDERWETHDQDAELGDFGAPKSFIFVQDPNPDDLKSESLREGGSESPEYSPPVDPSPSQAQPLDCMDDENVSTPSSSLVSIRISRGASPAFTQSSMTSMLGQPLIRERLITLLRQDEKIRDLCDLAVQKSTWHRFEENFRRCLIQLSRDLRVELPSREATQAAKAIRTFARNVAQSVRSTLELQQITKGSSESTTEADTIANTYQSLTSKTNQPGMVQMDSEASDEDEMEPVDDLDENAEQFKELEWLIVHSKAFEMFKERFNLFVHPGPARLAVFEAWPVTRSMSSQLLIAYDVEWDLEAFIAEHVKDLQKIGDLVTLTGDSVNAEALSSREYLSRTWPVAGPVLLRGIEELLLKSENTPGKELRIEDEVAILHFIQGCGLTEAKTSRLSLSAIATYPIQVQLASALSWMCSTFRCSSHIDVMISSTSINFRKSPSTGDVIAIHPDVLRKPPVVSCWHSLFPQRVVARGFPFSTRQQGVGIEISFDNMAAASRCLSFMEYENGLIAHGLTSILIPMVELEKDDAIQWHLEDKRKQKLYKLARVSQVFSSLPELQKRYKELQPEKLVGRRCFLGLAEHANVVIGTKEYQREFSWSGIPKSSAESYRKSHNLSLKAGFMGFFSVTGNYSQTRTPIQPTICSSQDKDIFEVLDSGREHLALFFDVARKTGWYLPKISVALQMAHAIISMHGYRIYDGPLEVSPDSSLGFANASPNAAAEASNAVKNSLRLKIRMYNSGTCGPVDKSFAELFTKVWHTLSDFEIGLESTEAEFHKPAFIRGVEFLDAVNMEKSIRIKAVKVGQAWAHLTSEQPLVIFSKNIEPPIVPESKSLCKTWRIVPPNQGYLVLTSLTISSFLERRHEGLADRLDWNYRAELIQSHKPGKKISVNHTQKLVSRRKLRGNSPIRKMLLMYPNGCFVFGPDTESECRDSIYPREPSSEKSTWAIPPAAASNPTPTLSTLSTLSNLSDSSLDSAGEARHHYRISSTTTAKSQLQMAAATPRTANMPEIEPSPGDQNSAKIRLKTNSCEEVYVLSRRIHSIGLGPRSLSGRPQSKRQSKFFSNPEERISTQKSKGAEPGKVRDGSLDLGHEYDDLYDA